MKKTIRILVALTVIFVLCLALASCGHKSHTATGDWLFDDTHHWHACEKDKCEDAGDKAEHTYDNACDVSCNVCGAERTVGAHTYDNACDVSCNVCGAERTVGAHTYDNACDTTCNTCGATRTTSHDYADTLTKGEETHYYACSVCGDKKDEVAHTFDKEVASSEFLKAEATETAKAQYYKSCVCGAKSATEYFETDKAPANLQISDISKTYDGTPVAEPTVTFDGVGAENFAYYKGDEKLTERPADAGTYKVVVTVDETDTHAGDRVEKEFTIAKKVLSNLSVDLIYDGTNSFEVPLGEENGIAASDVADNIKVCITFANKNVGAAVTGAGLDADDGDNYLNYELDLTTCTANIVKRVIWTTGVTFQYGNCTNYTGEESPNVGAIVFQNIVAGETIAYDCVGWRFADVNVGAKLVAVTLYPEDDAVQANYEIDLSKCEAEIVKADISFTVKVDNKTYDGEAIDFKDVKYTSHPPFVDFSTATIDFKLVDEGEDHYGMNNTPVDAGEYIVRVSIDETENYESYIAYAKFTISPKVINNVKFDFTYNGNDYHQIYLTTENQEGIIGTEQILLEVVFEDVNVDSPVLEAELEKGNYALGTYDLSIVPKALTGSIFLDIYYGDTTKVVGRELYYYDYEITEEEYGVVNGDSVTLRALYESPNAGTADTSCGLYEESNYVMGDLNVNNTVISVKTIELPEKQYVAEYTGSSKLILDLSEYAEYGETLEMYFTAMAGTPSLPVSAVGEYTNNVSFSKINYSDTTNYEIILPESYSLKIAPKKLTNLDLKITYNTYDTLSIYLISKDGIVEGEEVKLMPGKNLNAETFKVGDVITLKKFVAGITREEKEEVVFLAGADKNNYDLADACGTMTCVAYCDVQYDGSCNCGTSHLTETLTFTDGEAVGKSATIACDSTYEGGIYKIALEGGTYEFSGSDQFFNISGIYDAKGNKLASSIGTYALAEGTYYFHVYVGSSPSSDTIWVKKTGKMLDIENEEIIVTQITDPDDLSYRDEEIADYHTGGERFVLFYSRNEEDNVLGCSITFYYADENGNFASSATSNIESIEFYDINGRQLPVTYDEPDMIREDSVTAIGGVYIVITMNGEGEHLRFGAC